jgi:hypothetical protein
MSIVQNNMCRTTMCRTTMGVQVPAERKLDKIKITKYNIICNYKSKLPKKQNYKIRDTQRESRRAKQK